MALVRSGHVERAISKFASILANELIADLHIRNWKSFDWYSEINSRKNKARYIILTYNL